VTAAANPGCPLLQKNSRGWLAPICHKRIPDEVMERTAAMKGLALIVVPLIIGVLIGIFAVIAYFMVRTLGLPDRLHIPWQLRAIGVGVLALG
jgi:hypothetical protein